MKTDFHLNVKEYFWNSVKKITNMFTKLTVNNLDNGYIKCFWDISPIDNFRIEFSQSCFYAIRIFDISNSRNKNTSTCIMKEIQVSKFQSSILFPIPINKGMYYFEFGYRKKNGEWRNLAIHYLNLGYRIKKVIKNYDNWFDSENRIGNTFGNFHEEAYQLSLSQPNGGSEKLISDKKNN